IAILQPAMMHFWNGSGAAKEFSRKFQEVLLAQTFKIELCEPRVMENAWPAILFEKVEDRAVNLRISKHGNDSVVPAVEKCCAADPAGIAERTFKGERPGRISVKIRIEQGLARADG